MSNNGTPDINNGRIGYWHTLKNGTTVFEDKGRAVYVTDIEESIETDDVYLNLKFDYIGKTKFLRILRDEIADPAMMKLLARKGGAGGKGNYDCLTETLVQQEEEFDSVTPVFENLGWIKLPQYNDEGEAPGDQHCFRADTLIGHCEAIYVGTFDVAPYGSYATWKQMVVEEIVPTPVLQLVLIAALSSVVLGLIAEYRCCENPIVHLCYASGRGKTTALEAACSTAGRPFEGEHYSLDENGQTVVKHSLFQSWSSTDNAMVTRQAGNRGMVTILNELGKSMSSNMTRLIFDLSEGSDKARLSKNLRLRVSEGYTTVFISCGESSLLDRCKSKYEGLRIRVMEIDRPITTSAAQARRIKETCRENGGFAVRKLAKYIIDQGGVDYVLPIYDHWLINLEEVLISQNNKERFIEKFAALFMATAEIATKALKIPFDMDGLQNFLKEYDQDADASRNSALESYDIIIAQCRIHSDNFYERSDKSLKSKPAYQEYSTCPRGECWGRITNKSELHGDGRIITQEFEVRKKIVEDILRNNGFQNKKTCIAAWKEACVLDVLDDTHPCRKRKIDPSSPDGSTEAVYVFRIFCDPADANKHWAATVKNDLPQITPVTVSPQFHIGDFTMEGGDNDGSNHARCS